MPNYFWPEVCAIATVVYLLKRIPTTTAIHTALQRLIGFRPNIGHLKVFGCKKMRKLDPKEEKCVFTYDYALRKAYKCYNRVTK